ncbi:MAG: hypothetical protein AAFY08_14090 [Planctomycetota bacterium]
MIDPPHRDDVPALDVRRDRAARPMTWGERGALSELARVGREIKGGEHAHLSRVGLIRLAYRVVRSAIRSDCERR